ncbi:PspC domain-containing protein [Bacteroides caecigallinarum]|uniref:PspC domain-containing protein n=1 Tax=Bacteroides caecigallinarum TaxID=1411144 RepID=UPI001F24A3F9|nr:PspC domain-containing protein [Bacteroides caecigallinarum]MCF2593253.1 PspC domain-containing protein [Bacteroides caecigallinarum]
MKKTLTVNLGGTVYHIDEDAYVLLDNYLNNLKYHFRSEADADEIVKDMENRIAELFSEYISRGQQVITIENVEEVIARMGKPEEINAEEELNNNADNSGSATNGDEIPKRRLFRNPNDKILGGVLSGLAAYFGWDVAWTRIAVLICGIFLHGFILAYIIAWIIIPVARTATEKLQMKGEPVNMENIGKTVTDGFEKMNDYVHSDKPRSFVEKLGNIFFSVLGFIVKLAFVILAICCAPVVMVGLIVLFALLMAATGVLVSVPAFFYEALPYINWDMVGTSAGLAVTMVVCGLLLIGIPVVGLIHFVLHITGKKEPMSTSMKILMILLWIVAASVSIVLVSQAPFIIHPTHLLFHRIL